MLQQGVEGPYFLCQDRTRLGFRSWVIDSLCLEHSLGIILKGEESCASINEGPILFFRHQLDARRVAHQSQFNLDSLGYASIDSIVEHVINVHITPFFFSKNGSKPT